MNAGAHGSDLAATLAEATVLDLDGGEVSATERRATGADLQALESHGPGDRRLGEVEADPRAPRGDPGPNGGVQETSRRRRSQGPFRTRGARSRIPRAIPQAGLSRPPGLKGWRVGGASVSDDPRQLLHGRRHRDRPGRIRPNPRCAAKGKRCFRSGTHSRGQIRGFVRQAGSRGATTLSDSAVRTRTDPRISRRRKAVARTKKRRSISARRLSAGGVALAVWMRLLLTVAGDQGGHACRGPNAPPRTRSHVRGSRFLGQPPAAENRRRRSRGQRRCPGSSRCRSIGSCPGTVKVTVTERMPSHGCRVG